MFLRPRRCSHAKSLVMMYTSAPTLAQSWWGSLEYFPRLRWAWGSLPSCNLANGRWQILLCGASSKSWEQFSVEMCSWVLVAMRTHDMRRWSSYHNVIFLSIVRLDGTFSVWIIPVFTSRGCSIALGTGPWCRNWLQLFLGQHYKQRAGLCLTHQECLMMAFRRGWSGSPWFWCPIGRP